MSPDTLFAILFICATVIGGILFVRSVGNGPGGAGW